MSFCGNDAGSDRVWRGARLVRSHGTRLGARWCEAEARQDDVSGYGAMPLLVVGFAERVGAIRLDRASGRIGGRRVVRLERIVFGVILGAAVLQSRTARRTIALPSWLVPLERSCRAGWVLSGTGPGGVQALRRTCS